jgi:hypothetical protein
MKKSIFASVLFTIIAFSLNVIELVLFYAEMKILYRIIREYEMFVAVTQVRWR